MKQRASLRCMPDLWPKRSDRKSRGSDDRIPQVKPGFARERLRSLCTDTALQPSANKSPDPCACAAAHSPATAVPIRSGRDRGGSARSPENRIRFPRISRIAERSRSRTAVCAGRIAQVNVSFKEKYMPNRVDFSMVTTATELAGYRIVRNFGIVRGIIVRSRSVIGNLGAALQTIVGGNITILTNLCEKTREDAYELLLQHAGDHGANAVIGMRYDATEVMQGVTEVLAYGTAVQVERIS